MCVCVCVCVYLVAILKPRILQAGTAKRLKWGSKGVKVGQQRG